MGDWHQDIVFKDVSNDELERVATQVFDHLVAEEIISPEMSDNVLGLIKDIAPVKAGKKWLNTLKKNTF